MQLTKAIEILHLITDTPPSGANPDFVDAVKLGIEAIKRVKEIRGYPTMNPYKTLPSETEGVSDEHR